MSTQPTLPGFTVSPWYPTASYPWGRPIMERRVCYVSAIATKRTAVFVDLPLSLWTITVYDDKPRTFNVKLASDSPLGFHTNSFRKALDGIASCCDQQGNVMDACRPVRIAS